MALMSCSLGAEVLFLPTNGSLTSVECLAVACSPSITSVFTALRNFFYYL